MGPDLQRSHLADHRLRHVHDHDHRHLGSGTAYPTGSTVSITIGSVTETATVDSNGDFTTTFSTASLGVTDSPYTVTYAFAGNPTFTAASDTSTTLTVTAAPLTASIVGDPTKTYDGTTSAALTQANFSLSGLVGSQSFTVTQTVGTYNSEDVTVATMVTASLTPSDFTPGPGTLASNYILPTTACGAGNINSAPLTVTATNESMTYGGTVPALPTPTPDWSTATPAPVHRRPGDHRHVVEQRRQLPDHPGNSGRDRQLHDRHVQPGHTDRHDGDEWVVIALDPSASGASDPYG